MANSVKERFNTSDAAENIILFEQVRIPLYITKGKAIDARGFAKNLQDFKKKSAYVILKKLMMKVLGQAVIVLIRIKKIFLLKISSWKNFLLRRYRKCIKDRFLFTVLIIEYNHFFTDFSF